MINTKVLQAYYNSLNEHEKRKLNREIKTKCFVSSNTVWKWMHGHRFPKKMQQNAVAEIVGIDSDKLFKELA